MKPLVSILIPAHNASEWIEQTIQSAVTQTWKSKEIIVVDDGSSDDTLAIARRFESHQVKVVSQLNRGASAARNTAYSLCRGDYIQWLDADDLLAPDKIAIQVKALRDTGSTRTLLSSAWGAFYYRKHKAKFCPTRLWDDLEPADWIRIKLQEGVFMQPGVFLVSRDLTDAAGPWDVRLWKDNDGEYFCRVVAASDGVRFIPGAATYYRQPGIGRVSYIGGSNKKLESLFLSSQLQISHLLSLDDSEQSRIACRDLLQHYLGVFYPERLDLAEESRKLAMQLGYELSAPRMSWKYMWLQRIFGLAYAKRIELYYNRVKSNIFRFSDKAFFQSENRKSICGQVR